jgi:hypothetical protein
MEARPEYRSETVYKAIVTLLCKHDARFLDCCAVLSTEKESAFPT